jgi:hypothetical protein
MGTSQAAQRQNASAENSIGKFYDEGYGVPKDSTEAIKWFRLASEHGNGEATAALGEMYYRGNGVRADRYEAIRLGVLSAKQGELFGFFLAEGAFFFSRNGFRILEYDPPGADDTKGDLIIQWRETTPIFVEIKAPSWHGELTSRADCAQKLTPQRFASVRVRLKSQKIFMPKLVGLIRWVRPSPSWQKTG